jgi:deleted-in-malignant-brain-tumors protein 1
VSIISGPLHCTGRESSLLECGRNDRSIGGCSANEVAGIQCEGQLLELDLIIIYFPPIELCSNGNIRISGGSSDLIGRIEVCVNRTWGSVCGQGWSDLNAAVACRQAGHSSNGMHAEICSSGVCIVMVNNMAGAIAGTGSFTGTLNRPSYMRSVFCNGSEPTLFQCSYIPSNFSCPLQEIAGVICQGNVVL